MGRGRDRDHARCVPGGGAEEGRPGHVDELDGLVDGDLVAPHLGRERLDVDDDDVDEPDPLFHELLQLLRPVAAREDAGVDLGVEGPDLAPDEGRSRRQLGD